MEVGVIRCEQITAPIYPTVVWCVQCVSLSLSQSSLDQLVLTLNGRLIVMRGKERLESLSTHESIHTREEGGGTRGEGWKQTGLQGETRAWKR